MQFCVHELQVLLLLLPREKNCGGEVLHDLVVVEVVVVAEGVDGERIPGLRFS